MQHPKFCGNRSTGSGEEDFEGFYHILAWRPSWLNDTDVAKQTFVPSMHRGSTQNLAL